MWHNARAPATGRWHGTGRRHGVKTRSSAAFRQWPAGLLVEIAAYLLLMGTASLIALIVAEMA